MFTLMQNCLRMKKSKREKDQCDGSDRKFGNILAAYYAKQMGVPIAKLICASNENKVLFDFFKTGVYDKNREFILTSSPSMDILISSNLERLIYTIAGQDAGKNAELMRQLKEEGVYEITEEMRGQLGDFVGGFATEEETKETIKNTYEKQKELAACYAGPAWIDPFGEPPFSPERSRRYSPIRISRKNCCRHLQVSPAR